MKTLHDRLKEYVVDTEFSANASDGRGPRCPCCGRPAVDGHNPPSNGGCRLGRLCDDIRLVQRARELEPTP
jgi:hypothetical protein